MLTLLFYNIDLIKLFLSTTILWKHATELL